MNLSDAERVSTVLEALGYSKTDDEEDAAILGLVACSVRQRAIDRAYAKIRRWNRWKDHRSLLTFATGCVLPKDRERFAKYFDLFFPITELPDLPHMIRQYGAPTALSIGSAIPETRGAVAAHPDEGGSGGSAGRNAARPVAQPAADDVVRPTDFWRIDPTYASSFEAFVPIQNGCDKFCSFCAVPYTRGREVSRASADILGEVETLLGKGYRTITLLGQNVNSYGLDKKGDEIGFAELLHEIGLLGDASDNNPWVYFTSPHPRDMTPEVVRTIAAHPSLANQIHLPLQSGDDALLESMNRRYSLEQYRSVVAEIRSTIPEATLFTDIIVGFPGETEVQFENTRKAMTEFQFNMAYIAMYSPRPGAKSARLPDDVPHDEKRRRLHELSGVLKASSLGRNQALIGTEMRVLVTGQDRKSGFLAARTEGRIIVRFPSEDESLIGTFVNLRIDDAAELSIEGKLAIVKSSVPA